MWRSHESRSTPGSWRGLAHNLSDLEKLLLLATILLENLVKIDIFGVTAFDLGSFGLCLLLAFAGLLGCFLGLRTTSVDEVFDGGVFLVGEGRTFLAFLTSPPFFLSLAIMQGMIKW